MITIIACALLVLGTVMPARATYPGANGRIAFQLGPLPDGSAQIFTMNPDGSDVLQLTGFLPGEGSNIFPKWSPDGTKIAFDSSRDGDREIFVMNHDGANPVQLTFNTGTDRTPTWSPDGTKLIYSSNLDGDRDIWMLEIGTGQLTQITDGPGTDINPVFSPDGQRIAFSRFRGNGCAIYTVHADGTHLTRLTGDLKAQAWDWAPGGNFISLVDNACADTESDLFLKAPTGKGLIQLTNTATNEFSPRFSPDGTSIVFTRADLIDEVLHPADIYVMAIDGSGATNLTNTPAIDELFPDWGPA
ncbi:MAG: hypothetical protein WEB06_12515 [Actinomycetota bacterium]